MSKKLRVLISAYACEPNKGSEPEVGWQWALEMARFHEVTVLTRANNRLAIEEELESLRGTRPLPQFIYHDEGPLLLWLKKRLKVIRLYYILWQQSAWDLISRLHEEHPFDLLHHVTFAGFRYRAAIWHHGVPTVWGPIGGIESIPWRLLPWGHPRSLVAEIFRNINNFIQSAPFHVLPRRVRATTVTLVSTQEMKQTLFHLGFETKLMPTIGLHVSKTDAPRRKPADGPLKVLFVGNIITLKGVDLALQAVRESGTYASFTLVGDGNFLPAARKLAGRLGLKGRVDFRGRLSRQETLKLYPEFDLFLFPSLHDTGGYAVIEAMACGLPVICLDCGGPRVSVKKGTGIRVPLGSRRQVVLGLAEALRQYDGNRQLLTEHGQAAREVILRDYDWEKKGGQLNAIYEAAADPELFNETRPGQPRASRSQPPSHTLKKILNRLFPIKGLAVSAVMLLFIGMVGFFSVDRLKNKAQLIVEDTLPGLSDAGAANASMAEAFNRTLLALMAETPAEREIYRREVNEFSRQTDEYLDAYLRSIFSGDDRANYDKLLKRRDKYHDLRQQTFDLLERHKKPEALALCKNSLLPAYREYKAAGEKLLEYNALQGESRGQSIMKICAATQYVVAAIGIALFVVGFIVGLFK